MFAPRCYTRVMRYLSVPLLLVVTAAPLAAQEPGSFETVGVERFARLALQCVHQEYPNKIAHVMQSDSDAQPPRRLTPAFYGCFDWHSSVHAHWMLARLARLYPDQPFSAEARRALDRSLTATNIAREVAYFEGPGRASFERPYGLAWLLQLGSELREWDDPDAERWSSNLRPLESAVAERLTGWLPKLSYPVRSGEHSQTAFALGLSLDWARTAGEAPLADLIESKARAFYLHDRDCPIAYEPSGEDFVSPCLAEADLVRRTLAPEEFAAWLGAFLPGLPLESGEEAWLSPAVVTDPTDGKLAHLDGLNLSRAWMLDGIASALPARDPRRAALLASRDAHAGSGVASVTGQHYEGGHWLGSFATYLVTRRGVPASPGPESAPTP